MCANIFQKKAISFAQTTIQCAKNWVFFYNYTLIIHFFSSKTDYYAVPAGRGVYCIEWKASKIGHYFLVVCEKIVIFANY